uniref:Uncharacterized protein LOC114338707 n=1 Tax=Diabrotica virgifera virgifera TaxID=50390 RepID=A0A6P7GMS9_DIAVI
MDNNMCSACSLDFVRRFMMLEEEITSLKNKINQLENNSSQTSANSIYYEVQQRIERANNLIIYKMPESNSNILSERINHDKGKVNEIFRLLGIQQQESSIEHVVRIGKSSDSNRIRPVKVVCNSNTVKLALKSGNKLRGSIYSISRDQTRMEIDAYKAAKRELEERKSAGEVNLGIIYQNGAPVVKETKQKN